MKKNPIYIAATLTRESQLKLYEVINFIRPIPHDWKVYCHHMTIHFKPKQGDKLPHINTPVSLSVMGYAADEKGITVKVMPTPSPKELYMSENQTPHVTVATAPGVAPIYSGDLLRMYPVKAINLNEPLTLDAFVWAKDFDGVVSRNDLAYETLK
jgi:hypothetical protein